MSELVQPRSPRAEKFPTGETRLRHLIEPLATGIPNACFIAGFSRATMYRLLAAKQITAVKSGSRTLVLMDSLRQYLASLPAATFQAPRSDS